MSFALFSVNLWAVLVAGALYFILGALWYGILGNAWMREIGKTPEELKQSPLQYLLSLIAEIGVAYAVAVALNAFRSMGLGDAIFIATFLWFFIALLPEIVHYAYEGKSLALLVINKGYDLLGVLVAAVILTFWQ